MVASVLFWDASVHLLGPSAGRTPSRTETAPSELTVQAAAGKAIEAQWSPPEHGPAPDSYQVAVVEVANGQTVALTQVWSPEATVGGLRVGEQYRVVVQAGEGLATSAPVTVLADQPPDPPFAVVASQQAGTNAIDASWTPAPTGVAATGAFVQLYGGGGGLTYLGYLTCQAGCTGAVFRDLAYGPHYTVRVEPTNSVGQGPAAVSEPVDLVDPCPAAGAVTAQATCVAVDATTPVGATEHRAEGFQNSIYPESALLARANALKPYSWRGAPTYQAATGVLDWSSWDAAVDTGAQTTLLLSNLWQAETNTGTGARTPWSDWVGYSHWVTDTVQKVESSGHKVSYWEIQNEPGGIGYFSAADWAASTPADYLQQFLVAYQAIKAADPKAAIIGPSLSHFADYPGEFDPHEPDLVTFLNFAARHGLRLAAVTWHEIDDDLGPLPRDFNEVPANIEDHVAEARRLIAERPALGDAQVWVNEYGQPSDYAIPGWTLADIVALEGSGVDRAGRSCWPEAAVGGAPVNDCAAPTLDGLLESDGSTPRPDYWVYAIYARMTGQLVDVTSSDVTVTGLASLNGTDDQVLALVGRNVSCLPAVNLNCPQSTPAAPPPATVAMTVRTEWTSVDHVEVSIVAVPPTSGALAEPPTVFHGPVAVTKGMVSVPLPQLADGEVYAVTISR